MADGVMEKFQVFEVRPQLLEHGKKSQRLAPGTDVITATVQVIAGGGETNLHAHKGNDAFWLVLQGEATFYTTEDRVVGKIGRYQGIIIPRETPYWFESSSPENLVILRVGANALGEQRGRIDYTERTQYVPEGGGSRRGTKVLEGSFFGT